MKHYQIPNTQLVRLSSGEVMQTGIGLIINGSGNGDEQSSAMAPRREI